VSLTACWGVAGDGGDGDVVVDSAVVRGVLDAESSLALSFFQLSLATAPPGALLAALATVVRLTAALPLEIVPSNCGARHREVFLVGPRPRGKRARLGRRGG
jgi:hypothetical protein